MKLMHSLVALGAVAASALVVMAAGGGDPQGFASYTAADLKSQVGSAKLDEHKVGAVRVANWGNHGFMVIRREGDGEAEVHDTQVDVMFVTAGEGTLVLGGTVVDGRQTAPGETRGKSIQGGTNHKLAVGDVLHIPAKIPHQVLVPKSITYEVVKVDSK